MQACKSHDLTITCRLQSKELSHIHLRWGERKVLNTVNQRKHDNEIRFHVPEPNRPDKPRVRITSGPEKIVILVRGPADPSNNPLSAQVLRLGIHFVTCRILMPCQSSTAAISLSSV